MIRASGLYGRALVDLDTADRLGYVDEIIVDPYGPCIAGFVVARGRSVLGSRKHTIIPAEAIYAIGPDALTIRNAGRAAEEAVYLNSLPRLSELTGRKMVSFGGKFLGTVEDALIDEHDGRIIGYPLDGVAASGLERLFSLGLRQERSEYVRADADLRVGARLIVVPDDAVAAMDEAQTPALPERAASAMNDSPTPMPATYEPERRTPATRHHRRMAVPFSEHDAALAATRSAELPTEQEARPFGDEGEALDEELVTTSQIRAEALRDRRVRAEREEVAG